jgi:hypothetical protein
VFKMKICKEGITFMLLWLFTKYYSGNQIEKNEMGGACSMYGGKESCIQDFGGDTSGKATAWETQA